MCLPRQQHTSPLQFSCENVHRQWRMCGKRGKHLCPCSAAAAKVTADSNLDRCHVNSNPGDVSHKRWETPITEPRGSTVRVASLSFSSNLKRVLVSSSETENPRGARARLPRGGNAGASVFPINLLFQLMLTGANNRSNALPTDQWASDNEKSWHGDCTSASTIYPNLLAALQYTPTEPSSLLWTTANPMLFHCYFN